MSSKNGGKSRQGQRRVVELFAGVGGFRLGLQGKPDSKKPGPWKVVWANQWEPGTSRQHAFDCYWKHFHPDELVHPLSNEDIALAVASFKENPKLLPDYDLLVGGFPCQDYSVAKALSKAHGIEGKKGVLWFDIYRLLNVPGKRPPFVLLENVDRLLKSPVQQRGRDFAIILSCLASLGYVVEWRVVNAAEYGYPQRRRRVFLLARPKGLGESDPEKVVHETGVLARALPVLKNRKGDKWGSGVIDEDPHFITETFPSAKLSPFLNAGVMIDGKYFTYRVTPTAHPTKTLGDIIAKTRDVPDEFYVPRGRAIRARWKELKGAKNVPRSNGGFDYIYSEGGMAFPDPLDRPSRTILTGEGGATPSRFKHVIETEDGRWRRLVPEELERLNGFPKDWTKGMPDTKRAFMMGNALVVQVVERIGKKLDEVADDLAAGWKP